MTTLSVIDPGPLTTVQDRGRPGLAHLGVPPSGALDRAAAARVNGLIGNPAGAAVLETTLRGPILVADQPTVVAVGGAPAPVTIDGEAAPFATAIALPAGARLRIGTVTSGLRSYLAVAGGIDVPPVLGSRSTDVLSGLGPDPLRAGDRLPIGAGPTRPPNGTDPTPRDRTEPFVGVADPPAHPAVGPVPFPAAPGPRVDWFGTAVLQAFHSAVWRVTPDSNRVGLRLAGPVLRRRDARQAAELPPEPLVRGSVQITAAGLPVLFLADHPTTGGYPVIAVVTDAALDRAAQLRPGTPVRFTRSPG